jgi:hypothetical protein
MARIFRLEHKTLKSKLYPNTPTFTSPYEIGSYLYRKPKAYGAKLSVLTDVYQELNELHNSDNNYRPAPFQDGIDLEFEREFCGSPSVDDLAEWFEGVFDKFLELGFVVREYIVDSTKIGNSGLQCVARYSEIKESKIIELNLVNSI